MRALVTGATGFIGNYLVGKLRNMGWDVVCMVRHPVECNDAGIVCLTGDLLNPASLYWPSSRIGQIDVIFHMGALLPGACPDDKDDSFFVANSVSTYNLLKVAGNIGASSFIYASSLPVIGKPARLPVTEEHMAAPLHSYLLSKLHGEMACEMMRKKTGMKISSLRITSPYGPGMATDSVLPLFVNKVLAGEDIQLHGTGCRSQDFIHVKDVVQACLRAVDSSVPGIYNVACGESRSMLELAGTIIQLVQESSSQVVFSGKDDPQDDYRWEVSLSRSEAELKFFPEIAFQEGLAEYIVCQKEGRKVHHWWGTP